MWARPRSARTAAWSAADLLLLDEVAGLLERQDGYDHVVAVEPATIAASEARGAYRLYVVLTRAVSRLHVLHSAELPF